MHPLRTTHTINSFQGGHTGFLYEESRDYNGAKKIIKRICKWHCLFLSFFFFTEYRNKGIPRKKWHRSNNLEFIYFRPILVTKWLMRTILLTFYKIFSYQNLHNTYQHVFKTKNWHFSNIKLEPTTYINNVHMKWNRIGLNKLSGYYYSDFFHI